MLYHRDSAFFHVLDLGPCHQEIPTIESWLCNSSQLGSQLGAGRFPKAQRSLRAAQRRRPNGSGAGGSGAAGQAKARETLVGCAHLGGDLDGAEIGWFVKFGIFFWGETVTEVFCQLISNN